MSLTASMRQRDCPVCGEPASKATLFLERSLDESRLTKDSFASRKTPEFMSYHLVKCWQCATVFAAEAPDAAALATAYHQADYSTAAEAVFAARTYQAVLEPFLPRLPRRGIALEIGTGTGIFLRHLRALGFAEQVGIEPSTEAMAVADADVKGNIRQGVFVGDEYPPNSLSFICCFQTLEHVPDPRGFVEAAFQMLEPGGMIALITHDYTAPINRILGKRSPIIDIEHVQIFCPQALRHLVTAAGYSSVAIQSFRNVYPLSYWMSLLPVPNAAKLGAISVLRTVGLGSILVGMNVGNLLTVAQKPL